MEKLFYDAKDIMEITGFKRGKASEIIRRLNCEIETINKDKPENEKPLILKGRVNKEYFNEKIKI